MVGSVCEGSRSYIKPEEHIRLRSHSILMCYPCPLPRGPSTLVTHTSTHKHTSTHTEKESILLIEVFHILCIFMHDETKIGGIKNSKMLPLRSLKRYYSDKWHHIRLPECVFCLYALGTWMQIWLLGSPAWFLYITCISICKEGVRRAYILPVSTSFRRFCFLHSTSQLLVYCVTYLWSLLSLPYSPRLVRRGLASWRQKSRHSTWQHGVYW